jgi:CheY-like chemotaxis protein
MTSRPFDDVAARDLDDAPESDTLPTVLVVDDSPVDQHLMGRFITKHLGWPVLTADNGAQALAVLERHGPAVVLTDLVMPEMDGLELVRQVRRKYPHVPVVLITAYGSEELALQALQQGAASYVSKKSADRDLAGTLERVLSVATAHRRQRQLLRCLSSLRNEFVLGNDPELLPPLVTHFQEQLVPLDLGDSTERMRIGVALEEALLNGLFHGNLEVSSELREGSTDAYYRLAGERRRLAPYAERRLHVRAELSRTMAVFTVRDEGVGFDPSVLPDPTDPRNLGRSSGRGLFLIRSFMDEVRHNAAGNEITLVKRRRAGAPAEAAEPCAS